MNRSDRQATGKPGGPAGSPLSLLLGLAALAGCEVRTGQPDALWLFWLAPGLLLFYVHAFRTRDRLLSRFASPQMLPGLLAGLSRPRRRLKAFLVLLAVLALLGSLAQPRWGFTWEEVRREGVDIVIALDVSDSMLVRDAETGGELSRLERAKREIADLLQQLEGDRIALVAFAGTAFLELPLTLDYSAAALFLEAMEPDLIPVKGTAIGEALRVSLGAFERVASVGSRASRAVILITDGEDHLGKAQEVAEEAAQSGVRVFAIGIGRDEGAPIPRDGGGFRTDRRGEIIMSRLDEAVLQRIALTTGGRYVRSVTGDVDLEQIYAQGIKATLEDQELGSSRRQRWEERFQWLLVVALIALMLEPFIGDRQRRRPAAVRPALLLLGCALLLPGAAKSQQSPAPSPATTATAPTETPPLAEYSSPYAAFDAGAYDQALERFADAQTKRPDDPELSLNLGATLYRLNDFEAADAAFFRASAIGDEELRAQALYNLGNSAYRQGKLSDAVDFYMASLEANPDDHDAKFNLEFVREEMKRRQQNENQGDADPQEGDRSGDQSEGESGRSDEGEDGRPSEDEEPSADRGADADNDGLSDHLERNASNPTDPENPDSDADGVPDGQEDRNRNGRVDPGETDPNRQDSDGDGIPDAQDEAAEDGGSGLRSQSGPQELPEGMTPEEAERYLQALQEGRPDPARRGARGRSSRQARDW